MAEEGTPMEETCPVREQDKFLPIANISRIMKEALPQNAKVSKDAKELVQNCVSDFIIYITSQASDKCQREKRKTVNGDDLLWSMQSLGFDDAVVVLQTYLAKIREAEGEEKSAKGGAGAPKEATQAPAQTTSPQPQQQAQPHMQQQQQPQHGMHMVPDQGGGPGMPPQGYPMMYAPMHMQHGQPMMMHGQPHMMAYPGGQHMMMQVPMQQQQQPGQMDPQFAQMQHAQMHPHHPQQQQPPQ